MYLKKKFKFQRTLGISLGQWISINNRYDEAIGFLIMYKKNLTALIYFGKQYSVTRKVKIECRRTNI